MGNRRLEQEKGRRRRGGKANQKEFVAAARHKERGGRRHNYSGFKGHRNRKTFVFSDRFDSLANQLARLWAKGFRATAAAAAGNLWRREQLCVGRGVRA